MVVGTCKMPPCMHLGAELDLMCLHWGAVVVVGTCKDSSEVAEPLRAAGRLDVVVSLPTPGAEQRAAMLAADLEVRGAHLPQAELQVETSRLPKQPLSTTASLFAYSCRLLIHDISVASV